jgi:hypothetical protein
MPPVPPVPLLEVELDELCTPPVPLDVPPVPVDVVWVVLSPAAQPTQLANIDPRATATRANEANAGMGLLRR